MKIQHGLYLSLTASAALALLPCHAQGQAAQSQPVQSKPAQSAPAPASAPASGPASAATPISLPVTVVNDHGDPVKNLSPSTLTLIDNGQPQKVDSFSLVQPGPMTIGIIAQTSRDVRFELGDERLASAHFVDHTIPGSDNKFFVIQYSNEVDLLENPTSNVNKLHDAINQLGSPQFGNQSGGQSSDDQSSSGRHAGGAFGGTLYDAIYLACTEVMKQQPGRHVLIVITDGVDRGSKESFNEAVEAAQTTNTMIYSIYFKGEVERTNSGQNPGRRGGMGGGFPGGVGFPGGGGGGGGYPRGGNRRGGEEPQQPSVDGQKILEQLGNDTGGYMVAGKHDKADDNYNKLADLLKNQYTVTWTPAGSAASSSSHHISLTTKEKGVYTIAQGNYTAHP